MSCAAGPSGCCGPGCSVFAGGFELDAAERICADHRLAAAEVLDLLAALAGKSILTVAHGQGVARYRLPETLREYGEERLHESGEYTALRRRHRDWHEQLALRADADWLSPRLAEWAARLFREHANVAAAQDFCQAEPGEAEAGLRIALHVWLVLLLDRGAFQRGPVPARPGAGPGPRAHHLAGPGAAAGQFPGCRQRRPRRRAAAAGAGHRPGRAAGRPGHAGVRRLGAGHVCLFAGDLPQATAHFEDGLAVLPAVIRGRQRALLLIGLANAAGLAGDEERAVACHRELAALTEAGSDYIGRAYSAYSLWAVGVAAWHRGDLDRAAGLQQQSLRLRRNDRMGSTWCVEALAWIAASGRQYERAAVLLGAATGLWQSMGTTLDGNQPMAGHQRDCERQARRALGEAAFQAAYHRGLELPAADVLGYALQQPPEKPLEKPPAPAVPAGAPLTPRELQVARLIAAGRSNKDIAAALVISQRTAENHVEHILAKLGFTSRAQVAAWVAASQPSR